MDFSYTQTSTDHYHPLPAVGQTQASLQNNGCLHCGMKSPAKNRTSGHHLLPITTVTYALTHMQGQKTHPGQCFYQIFWNWQDTDILTEFRAEKSTYTHNAWYKKRIFFYYIVWTACQLPPTHTHTNREKKRDRAQLVSLINPNEVRLCYQKMVGTAGFA